MAASPKTVGIIVHKILEWQHRHGISNQATHELLEAIADVPGNQSFRTTVEMIHAAYALMGDAALSQAVYTAVDEIYRLHEDREWANGVIKSYMKGEGCSGWDDPDEPENHRQKLSLEDVLATLNVIKKHPHGDLFECWEHADLAGQTYAQMSMASDLSEVLR